MKHVEASENLNGTEAHHYVQETFGISTANYERLITNYYYEITMVCYEVIHILLRGTVRRNNIILQPS